MKFLVRKEARSPRTGKEKSLQHKPKISNLLHATKEKEKHFHKEILKKTNKYAQRKSSHTRKRIQKRIKALPDINKTRSLLTSSS
jgi:acetyl-CoA carboxylase beta subunit